MLEALQKKARRRILAVLRETGGRKRSVLDALAGGDRGVLDGLLAEGVVVMRGDKRGATYEHAEGVSPAA